MGMGFEDNGFCVVRGPDLITGGDILDFHPPPGVFDGVFGGSPCQDFSALNRNPGRHSHAMQDEFCRVVSDAAPAWFLFENVARAPSFKIDGYTQQRFELDLGWFTPYSRLRHFIFGSKSGRLLDPMKGVNNKQTLGTAVTGKDDRGFQACCEIQGLPSDFDLPFFSNSGKKQAVANGVPLSMSRYLAQIINQTIHNENYYRVGWSDSAERRCACQCGRRVYGKAKAASDACRKRLQRQRQLA